MGIKERDKRFGVTAVEKGLITLDQLFDAMKIQLTIWESSALLRLMRC